MKVNKKKTEYQKSYQMPDADLLKNLYSEGAAFRKRQRDDFLSCQFSLQWDSEDSNDECGSLDLPLQMKRQLKIDCGEEEEESEEDVEQSQINPVKKINEPLHPSVTPIPKKSMISTSILHERGEMATTDEKQVKPKWVRPSTSTRGRETVKEKPTFALYGSGNRSRSIGDKRSFNSTVAKSPEPFRREASRRMKTPVRNCMSTMEMHNKNSKTSQGRRATSRKNSTQWETEYSRSFSRTSFQTDEESTTTTTTSRPVTRNKPRRRRPR